jgi:hypothetical protein
MVNSKNAFWQAFVVTIFIFVAGLVLGFYVELSNVDKSDLLIRSSEADFLDQQIGLSVLSSDVNFNCETARKNLFEFADIIYKDATKFEEEDAQSKFTEEQRNVLHKRYDLLRLNLWMESLDLRKKCNGDFHTIVYFFDYSSPDVDLRSQQRILSLVLLDLKYKYPNKVLLIPIAANLDLDSINIIKENYNITKSPALIVDESMVIDYLLTSNELEGKVFGNEEREPVIKLNS